ncbi:hypothetical protein IAU60_000725 [Kwoniella sp. DSM 27419]
MFVTLASLLLVATAVTASPSQHKRADVHCGTSADATLSDCQALTSDPGLWASVYNTGNTCTFNQITSNKLGATAYNLACHGDCCVYYADQFADWQQPPVPSINPEALRINAGSLLGCGDAGANKVNVLGNFGTYSLCVSNGNGCGDCFDDSDFKTGGNV